MPASEALAVAVYASTPDYLLASCGPIFVVEWRLSTPMAGCLELHRQCGSLAKRSPNGVGLLTVIQADAPPPGAGERLAIAAFLRESHYIKTSAVVVDGKGFRSAFVRGVVTGLTMLARQQFPHRVLTMNEAVDCFCQALRPALDPSVTPARLLSEIEALRRQSTT